MRQTINLAKIRFTSGSGGGGGVQGVQPKVQNYFLRVVLNLQEMHYIFTKNFFFFPVGMPPDPLSYNMSDVNPHLTQCERPPYSM